VIEFTREETVALSERLRDWLAAELDVEIGGFDAEFLLDFVLRERQPRSSVQPPLRALVRLAC
jgi:uncharacterized protein (DUF2164 family)